MIRTVVVGGGAAGFFAAIGIAAATASGEVTILERGREVLEKVRISGGGRCNVTHACWDPAELVKFYPRGGRELLGPFHKFACGDTMGWFGDRGVALKVEEDGRVFPESDRSQTIIDCLWSEARRLGVRVVKNARVRELLPPATRQLVPHSVGTAPPTNGAPVEASGGRWTVKTQDASYVADRLVITTGSNPAMWKILEGLGHRIVPPVPSLFAFNVPDRKLRALAGISLPWVGMHLADDALQAEGPLLITHKGLSGPAILRLSAWGARQLHPRNYDFSVGVNWTNQRTEDVVAELADLRQGQARRQLGSRAYLDVPLRLWQYLVVRAGIPTEQQWAQLSRTQLRALATELTDGRYPVRGKATNKDEFTTAGGVDLREVDFRSFQSVHYPNLYLAGEVLDIDAITGGFNFQAAWTGGHLIGQHTLHSAL